MLVVPDIRSASCSVFSACAHVALSRGVKAALNRIGEVKVARSKGAYQIMIGNKDGHFHVDIISREAVDPNSVPDPNCKGSEWRSLANQLYGQKADVAFTATFRLAVSRLPEIIRAQRVGASHERVSMETVSGTFKVTGEAPFRSIEWWLVDRDQARIKLRARPIEVEIGDNYLASAFARLDAGFRAFVADDEAEDGDEGRE